MQVREVGDERFVAALAGTKVRQEMDFGSMKVSLGFSAELGDVVLVNGIEGRNAIITAG